MLHGQMVSFSNDGVLPPFNGTDLRGGQREGGGGGWDDSCPIGYPDNGMIVRFSKITIQPQVNGRPTTESSDLL